MLQKNQPPQRQEGARNHQMPLQDRPPSFQQLEEMASWANIPTNKGKTIELPFREFVLMVQKVGSMGLEWVLYRNDGVTSAREWDIVTDDVNMVNNTICAQFPDAEVSLATSARLGAAKMHLDGVLDEPATAAPSGPTMSDLAKKGKPSMTGGLRPSQLPALLQSIALGAMTGNLEIIATNDTAEMYFSEGKLYHCALRGTEGDGAVVELVSWESGDYAFYPDISTDKTTVRVRLENLLMEGMTLVDHYKGLQALGMTLEKYVQKKMTGITEVEFEQVVAKGVPADLNFQKQMYQAIDDKTTVVELLRRFPFPKRFWVPTLFNLAHCKLVGFVDAPPSPEPQATNQPTIEPMLVDWSQVRTAEKTLHKLETGIYSYPALLWFIEKEFARNEQFNRPFCLIVIEMGIINGLQTQPFNTEGMKILAQRIEKLTRKTDIVAHFETFSLAILLPETITASARGFHITLLEALYKSEILPGVPNEAIKLECGVSGIPDECKTIETLLAMAKPKAS